ncbi:MAG TPA: DNA-directed RNA polymerase subunit D [archaeon]|nr:DNA-directed RNA polymerase subunit D [archaeon]
MVEVKILQEKENSVKVLIKDTNAAFVNALRRQMMAGTPVLAIEDIHIYENNGAMHDEMLGHRLAMVPLKMDSKKYKEGDIVKLVLEKEGPCTVYSKDIKSTDPKIEPATLNIPLTKLAEGQKIKIEMDALVGIGSAHSKWQPAIVAYTELPIIVNDKGAKDKSYKADVIEMLLDEKHRDIILKENQGVEYDPTAFIFSVESHGNLTPKELFDAAVDELKKRTEEFRKELKNLS